MPNIQEAKCFEFTIKILPPPLGTPRGGGDKKCMTCRVHMKGRGGVRIRCAH